jgi:hypothetical protein
MSLKVKQTANQTSKTAGEKLKVNIPDGQGNSDDQKKAEGCPC